MVNILVQGASGNTGAATVKALHARKANVVAGVRELSKHKVGEAKAVVFDTSKPDEAVNALNGIDVLVVCPPGTSPSLEDRYRFAGSIALIIGRAKKQTLKHVVLLSVPGTAMEPILFTRQFACIERAIKATDIGLTILSLQMFTDNFLGWAQGIKQGKLYVQLTKGKKAFSPLTVHDIGQATAEVAVNYGAHVNKSYTLSGPEQLSADQIAAEFAKLGKPVEHVPVDAAATKSSLTGAGYPAWQAEGLSELFDLVDKHPEFFAPTPDLEKLLGRKPTDLATWIQRNKAAFA